MIVEFDSKNITLVLFLSIVSGSYLDKEVTIATTKGLSIICKF